MLIDWRLLGLEGRIEFGRGHDGVSGRCRPGTGRGDHRRR